MLVLAWEEWRNRKKQVALEEIVNGGEILKDTASEETVKQFKEAQSTAQSVATTKVVAEIQKTL